uniref:cyclin-A1-3-like n=1 Tax=Erigeron canadensis TaxID=72917 RepID=UPI001CB907BC|nr:cyclin-A1-3-like [Erigeron canadensis]
MAMDGVITEQRQRWLDTMYMIIEIYPNLRESEKKKRPAVDYMETVQEEIDPSMRAILIDWLVYICQGYRLEREILYLTVNYIDRYLSIKPIDRKRFQLLGVACLIIASKYEHCYLLPTDKFYYADDEILQMEATVLDVLKFEMTAVTVGCFVRQMVFGLSADSRPVALEYMASYISELSLLRYDMLCFAPSLLAASAIFLARFVLNPSRKPWNLPLRTFTWYQPSELQECVNALHALVCESQNSDDDFPAAIRKKYSRSKYLFVASIACPAPIPLEYFDNVSSSLSSSSK